MSRGTTEEQAQVICNASNINLENYFGNTEGKSLLSCQLCGWQFEGSVRDIKRGRKRCKQCKGKLPASESKQLEQPDIVIPEELTEEDKVELGKIFEEKEWFTEAQIEALRELADAYMARKATNMATVEAMKAAKERKRLEQEEKDKEDAARREAAAANAKEWKSNTDSHHEWAHNEISRLKAMEALRKTIREQEEANKKPHQVIQSPKPLGQFPKQPEPPKGKKPVRKVLMGQEIIVYE
jgi:hypothetical protein